MKPALVCARCGAIWDPSLDTSWGRSAESDGYGPLPRCVMLVPAPRARRARDRNGGSHEPLQVCGGLLAATMVANDTAVSEPTIYDEQGV